MVARAGLIGFLSALLLAGPAGAARIKDLVAVKGVRGNQIIGYGLVVGLKGTGDKSSTAFTQASLVSMLEKMGIGVPPGRVKVKNVAAVMVTADLPPFARAGSRIDAVVSSLGDATSLEGGTLILTPLLGADGRVYAMAQGPISVGGFAAEAGGSSVQKNHPTVGRVAGGVTVEREIPYSIEGKRYFELALRRPDFSTARRMAEAINQSFPGAAEARDAGTIGVRVPAEATADVVSFMAAVESLEVEPDPVARVVLNERTGTVVMGGSVRIQRVAVAHGSLSVTISTANAVSQPEPLSLGVTTPVQNSDVSAVEEEARLSVLEGGVSIDELVRGLNAMGVTPRDLIAILQAIKASGALAAEVEIM